ncbi:MAG: WecB/TagA/CpsF family glycosyltransferase [Clostridia bacterium]|nr:WecB/TagA/CpsF family glycosyltransferase [Clostridia bacterium]
MADKVNILGIKVDKVSIEQASDIIMNYIEEGGETKTVYTPNSEIIMQGYRSDEIRDVLNDASLLTADGIGVVYASKILKNPIEERCAGYDVACSLLEKMSAEGKSIYLFGSKPGVAETAAENIQRKHPGLIISGCADGYFDSEKEKQIIEDINMKSPDVLFVCLGAPKQEKWIDYHKKELNCKVCMGLGGSLDVFAGTVERAPEFYQKHGIEWLYRLIKQPKRFFRMLDLPKFGITVLFKGKKFKQE